MPDNWHFKFGRFGVRASCPNHPAEELQRCGQLATCPACEYTVTLCGHVFGTKECVLAHGHEGGYVSKSGSSWPDEVES